MYIEKRWLVPAALSVLLLSALFAVVLLLVGTRFTQLSASLRPAPITSVAPQAVAPQPPTEAAPIPPAPSPSVVAPADPAPPSAAARLAPQAVTQQAGIAPSVQVVPTGPAPVVADPAPVVVTPEEVVGIATSGSGATQINTRGFGDIGLQLQDVNINGPVTFVHISNQGNNNSTNVNTGDDALIVSDQKDLQSNRSDTAQPGAASATTTQPATTTQSDSAVPSTPAEMVASALSSALR